MPQLRRTVALYRWRRLACTSRIWILISRCIDAVAVGYRTGNADLGGIDVFCVCLSAFLILSACVRLHVLQRMAGAHSDRIGRSAFILDSYGLYGVQWMLVDARSNA